MVRWTRIWVLGRVSGLGLGMGWRWEGDVVVVARVRVPLGIWWMVGRRVLVMVRVALVVVNGAAVRAREHAMPRAAAGCNMVRGRYLRMQDG
jgi:hypothetical protein